MSKYRKLIVSLLAPIEGWAVASGHIPAQLATAEFIASVATVGSVLVYLVANRDGD